MVSPPHSRWQLPGAGLIVHADDFGLSERVNEGILLAHTKGLVTSTSIMAVGSAFEHAVELWRAAPSLDIGVHLTLTEEQPLLPAMAIPSLVGGASRFHRHVTNFAKRYALGKIRREEVRLELEAQLRKVLDSGLPVSHMDSHQHVHILPGVFAVVAGLARKYRIPAVRVPHERLSWKLFRQASSLTRALQLLVLNVLSHKASVASPLTHRTGHFAGFIFGGNLNLQSLRFLLRHLPGSGTCELMCHPGLDDPQSQYKHWGYQWSAELEALQDPECRSLLQQRNISLISYQDLVQPRGVGCPSI